MTDTCLEAIKQAIKLSEEGVSVAEYMQVCLSDPKHGYYMNNDPFGQAGDFVTAPEVSQIFGDIICIFLIQSWIDMGKPKPFALVELGPGRGTLTADIMHLANNVMPEFCRNLSIHLVETSPFLKEKQQQALANIENVEWHNTIDNLPTDIPLLIIGNEFFDALPIRQFIFKQEKWYERLVCWNEKTSKLDWTIYSKSSKLNIPFKAKDGDIYEISDITQDIMQNICSRLKEQKGLALFIDYGYVSDGLGDTLQALYKHKYADILDNCGEQDLTAHVDFSALEQIASNLGLSTTDIVTQASFLQSLGIEQYTEKLQAKATAKQAEDLTTAYHRLTATSEMGSLFKVLAVSY